MGNDEFYSEYDDLYNADEIDSEYYDYSEYKEDDDNVYADLYDYDQYDDNEEDEWSNANNLLKEMYEYQSEYDNLYKDNEYNSEKNEWSNANSQYQAEYDYNLYDNEEYDSLTDQVYNFDDIQMEEYNDYYDEENVFVNDKNLNNLPNNAWVWQLLILSFSLGVCSCLCYYATKVRPLPNGKFDFGHNKKGNYSKVDFESAHSAYDHDDVIASDHESDIELIEQS